MKENDQEPIGILGSFIDWREVYVPCIPFLITDQTNSKINKTMKTYKIPVMELHDTNIPDALVHAVTNGLVEHLNTSELGYTSVFGDAKENKLYIGIVYKGHDENIPRKFKIQISIDE